MQPKRFRTLIVEDNAADLQRLLQVIGQDLEADLDVLGTYQTLGAAALAIKENPPELLILDIHVGTENGLHLISLFDDFDFEVIVVSADAGSRNLALELSAIEFIHKPIYDSWAIQQALRRLRSGRIGSFKRRLKSYFHNVRTHDVADKLLTLRKQGREGPLEVPLRDILRVEAQRNYSYVYTTQKSNPELLSRNIGHFEKILPQELFIKPNRSNLINAYWIQRDKLDQKNELRLIDGTVLPVSPKRWPKMVRDIHKITGTF